MKILITLFLCLLPSLAFGQDLKATLNWLAVPNAEGYKIERNLGSGTYTQIAQTVGLTFVDTTVLEGQKYCYRVRAFKGATNYAYTTAICESPSIPKNFTLNFSAVVVPPPPPPTPTNTSPVVNAGLDQTITLPAVAQLNGTVTDDGLPSVALSAQWTKVSGAGTVTFSAATNVVTTATFSVAGSYVLNLRVSDGALATSDDVLVLVNAAPPPLPPPPPPPVGCSYYASPTGTGNGLSPSSPFQISNFWAVAGPGKSLCLLDGIYQGANSMIAPPQNLSGTAGNPITIRALNDGKATIDAQSTHWPVHLYYNDWFVLEGFNAHHSGPGTEGVVRILRSNNNVVRRVVAWDSFFGEDSNIFAAGAGNNTLFEDVAGFGNARKTFVAQQGGNYVTCRRCWGRWEGTSETGPKMTFQLNYNNYDFVIENSIGTWDGYASNAYGIFSTAGMQDPVDRSKILGSIAYLRANDRYPSSLPLVFLHGTVTAEIADTVAYVEPGTNPTTGTITTWPPDLPITAPPTTIARNLTGIGGSTPMSIDLQWKPTNIVDAPNVQSVAGSIFTGTQGAKICKRYQDRVLTNQPLWPWPMNQRIIDAMTASGRTPVDVTATIEQMFGPIPSQCKS